MKENKSNMSYKPQFQSRERKRFEGGAVHLICGSFSIVSSSSLTDVI